jgi:hypothetical protein
MELVRQPSQPPRPLSIEEKKRFILSTLPKMAEYTFPFTCSIVGILDKKTGRHIGSGLRCSLQGRRSILTAQHVLTEGSRVAAGFAVSAGYARAPFAVHGLINVDSVRDLAVYFLPEDYPADSGIGFWPSARLDRDRSKISTDYLFVHGYPGEVGHSYSSQLLQGVVNRSLPYGAMQRIDNLPGDLAPWQFAIEYDPIGMLDIAGTASAAVDPHGLSGSPVWRIGVSGHSAKDWRPEDSLLVGVVTQWRPHQKILVATSVSELPPDW